MSQASSGINRDRRGFALIELLVMIAAIALLTSMLFSALSRAMRQALRVRCLGNLKQLHLAWQLSFSDLA